MADAREVLEKLIWSRSLCLVGETDAQLRLTRVSRGLAERLGDEPQALVGRSLLEFLPLLQSDEIETVRRTLTLDRGVSELRGGGVVTRVMAVLEPIDGGALFFAETLGAAASPAAAVDAEHLRDELRETQTELDYFKALTLRIRREHVLTTSTGIYIRKMLDAFMDAEIGRSIRTGRPFALLLCGVDRAQALDQLAGEDARVKVVSTVARALSARKRVFDVLGQFSPSEFYIIQPENHSDNANIYAERIRSSFSGRKIRVEDLEFDVSLSFGLGHFHPRDNHYRRRAEMVSQVEAALFVAASSGGDRVARAASAAELVERINRPPVS